jgi:hypothetical protein
MNSEKSFSHHQDDSNSAFDAYSSFGKCLLYLMDVEFEYEEGRNPSYEKESKMLEEKFSRFKGSFTR